MNQTLFYIIIFLLQVNFLSGQRTLLGSVSDESGALLIGANILAIGTEVGVSTDLNGQFSLNIPNDSRS